MNKTIKNLSRKAGVGLLFGVLIAVGTMFSSAFTGPVAGPGGFDGPSNTSDRGNYVGYGRGWVANPSGSGSTALTKTVCDAAVGSGWYWFQDGNGDGDQTDEEDGECVRATTVNSSSWNGANQVTVNNVASTTTATGGSANTVVKTGAGWTADAYKNHIVKITAGAAMNCWGRVKTNTNDTITVYGTWLTAGYASNCGTPNATSYILVSDDWGQYDNSWIGDYTCSGNFPTGTVVYGLYPTSGVMALAATDCYDGKRDLLPNETDRAVAAGTATAADATSVTDSTKAWDANVWIGQKVLISAGTGVNSYGYIESNTGTQITVTDWLGGADPGIGSTFQIIYIVPHGSYTPDAKIDGDTDDQKANNGPLTAEKLKNWTGTRLPTANDFIGFCGYKDGGSNYESTTGIYTAIKWYGNYGGQIGRTDEFLDLANSGSWEWLAEQHSYYNARVAGNSACSYFSGYNVGNGYRFRAVFRP